MALGDGIRRDIATVKKVERDRLRDAILALNTIRFADDVSLWFKQDEIHDSTHVHFCPAFLPWHRELVNRFEAMLRAVDPELSLHYWDWTQDPTHAPDGSGGFVNFFTTDFMGNAADANGDEIEIGEPWKSAGFYGGPGPFRDDTEKPAHAPRIVTRQVSPGAPVTAAENTAAINAPDFVAFDDAIEGADGLHNRAHGFIGGSVGNPHTSFRDPFVYLLHSNVDRLFALWQLKAGHPERLDPAQIYKAQSAGRNGYQNTKGGQRATIDPPEPGQPSDDDVEGPGQEPWWGILSPLEPWAGPGAVAQTNATGIIKHVRTVRPWGPPENLQVFKDARDASVIRPPKYA